MSSMHRASKMGNKTLHIINARPWMGLPII